MSEPVSPAERYALGLLAEEMGEALQLIGKALRFGLDTPCEANQTARTLLPREIGDIEAAAAYAAKGGLFSAESVAMAKERKLARLLSPSSRDNHGRRLAPAPPFKRVTEEWR